VIVSDTAFLAGDVIAAEAGFACDPRDTAAFAALLRRLSEDDALCRRLSLNAFERTRHIGLTMDEWIDRLLAVYGGRLARHAA
jgi:glycosyltransferase involved in cell wall biosynthesis